MFIFIFIFIFISIYFHFLFAYLFVYTYACIKMSGSLPTPLYAWIKNHGYVPCMGVVQAFGLRA